ncbi:hypothetical protein BSKO_05401 [Bryopsis sp. KO-2023]|nr:hypothetical protein BSKO_05401 [Bryopsis sp. KO-2023]
MADKDAVEYQNRALSLEIQSLRDQATVFEHDKMAEENKRLRERVAAMSIDGATLRHAAEAAEDKTKTDVAKFQLLLEKMYRETLENVKEKIHGDILKGMNESTKDLMIQQDHLREEVATLKSHSSSLDSRCMELEAERNKLKIEADITKNIVEDQAKEIVTLKKTLVDVFSESGTLQQMLAERPVEDETHGDIEESTAEEIQELRESLTMHKTKLEEAYAQRDQWRGKCCEYSQACARLQAELQVAVDHLTIDPASYARAAEDPASVWQAQTRHVTFSDDTKNHSGKRPDANPWAMTGGGFPARAATGRPFGLSGLDEDDEGLRALEDALLGTGDGANGAEEAREDDPLAAFRPAATFRGGGSTLQPTASKIPPIDFYVMMDDGEIEQEKSDTPPGTPDFFKMEEAMAQPPEELQQNLEEAVENMWLVEDNGLVEIVSESDESCEDEEEVDALADALKEKQEEEPNTKGGKKASKKKIAWLEDDGREGREERGMDEGESDKVCVGTENPWAVTLPAELDDETVRPDVPLLSDWLKESPPQCDDSQNQDAVRPRSSVGFVQMQNRAELGGRPISASVDDAGRDPKQSQTQQRRRRAVKLAKSGRPKTRRKGVR